MEIKGFVEAISKKEIETKRGPSTKLGIKVGEIWINGWGEPNCSKGDYIIAKVEKNEYGFQIKSITKSEAPQGGIIERKEIQDQKAERIGRSTALAQANATISISGAKNVSEQAVLDLAEIYAKWIIEGSREFEIKEELVQ